jgi:hypothetical protein
MMKKLIILLSLFAFSQVLWSQNEYDDEVPVTSEEEFVGFNKKKNKPKKDLSRFRIGGMAGFGLANNQLGFSISPTLGYQLIEDRLEIGTGILYDYYRYKDSRSNIKLTQNTVGSNSYVRVYVWNGLFAQARGVYQKTYAKYNNVKYAPTRLGNVFAGAGYQFEITKKIFMNVGLEINLIPYDLSIVNSRAERVLSPFFMIQFSL